MQRRTERKASHYKNLFEVKDAFEFVNDAHLGTVSKPLLPAFIVAGK